MSPRFRGGLTAVAGVLVALVLAGHRQVPNWRGLGNTLDSGLPWLGLAVPALALAALARWSWLALTGVVIPAVMWAAIFGPAFVRTAGAGPRDLRVVHQNVSYANGDLVATARALRAADADILVAAEIPDDPAPADGAVDSAFVREINPGYPHRFPGNPGVAVWSRYPFEGLPRPVPGVLRAQQAIIDTPQGPVSLYAVHLASFRPYRPSVIANRNAEVEALARAVRADPSPRIIVVGDLNTATTDRELSRLTALLSPVSEQAGTGLQFTWPDAWPAVRLDHVLTRGFTGLDSRVLPGSGSDHRAILADLRGSAR
ncbi:MULTISPECIES: endonuclease/exonuclease/phosphatase family protein [Streptosporangium]|uniref:Vancomycin resistance protein VanJ n=1 Tax=Streptosporangium brasiliense TaxID=47480 RepID=A0ABT9R046_9ACTN|nr:endonuclease/exonuclease/phosphatase family protein [Streptosporangium brasiliense]MDP9862296.1 vancomycin resistance protein VanJ [Streptosporangium brasiliense]